MQDTSTCRLICWVLAGLGGLLLAWLLKSGLGLWLILSIVVGVIAFVMLGMWLTRTFCEAAHTSGGTGYASGATAGAAAAAGGAGMASAAGAAAGGAPVSAHEDEGHGSGAGQSADAVGSDEGPIPDAIESDALAEAQTADTADIAPDDFGTDAEESVSASGSAAADDGYSEVSTDQIRAGDGVRSIGATDGEGSAATISGESAGSGISGFDASASGTGALGAGSVDREAEERRLRAEAEAQASAAEADARRSAASDGATGAIGGSPAETEATGSDLAGASAAVGASSAAGTAATTSSDGSAVAAQSANVGRKPEGLSAPRAGQADDLKRIKGVGPQMEGMLNSMGYYHFDQVAAWDEDEVAWVDGNLEGFHGRVSRDRWVPQARLLADGTAVSDDVLEKIKAGETVDLTDYDSDGVSEGTGEGTRPAGLDGPRGGQADNLKEIKGIGPALEKLCWSLGFYHFDQIAAWGPDEVAWVDANLKGFKGRVTRDTWVAQAKILAAGGETEFSKRVDDGDVY